ncbi:prepilin peptidase [bacterium D16-50]|nr:prepilin peptidase [bacterium D16-50]
MPVNPAACQGTAMPPGMLLQAVLFLFLLAIVSACDIKNREIPDCLQAAIALLSLLHFSPWDLAGALTALPYLLVALAGNGTGGIGGGDIKLVASMGIVLGLPASLAASVMGLSAFIVYGLICSCAGRLMGRKGRTAYPAGPFLAAGAAAAYFMEIGGWTI